MAQPEVLNIGGAATPYHSLKLKVNLTATILITESKVVVLQQQQMWVPLPCFRSNRASPTLPCAHALFMNPCLAEALSHGAPLCASE